MKFANYLMISASIATPLCILSGTVLAADEHQHTDDEIVVTGSPIGHPEHESIIAASVLTADEIAERNAASIGELLRRQPGVSSTFFGPAASRPIIRGLGGDRVRVLDSGIGSIDASSVSDDHAVAVDPAQAERIEIVRGPASLYYGSSAAGGVVNVFDGRIPGNVPDGGIDGALRIGGASVDDSIEAAGGFDLLIGKIGAASLIFHGDGAFRRTEDYSIPGFAESDRLMAAEALEGGDEEEGEEEAFGVVENSDLETKTGAIGTSLVFEDGFLGVSVKRTRSNYGVPGAHHHGEGEEGEEEGEEEEVRIDLEQDRIDLMGELNRDFLIFQTAKIRFGYADYRHQELEGTEVGTLFANEGYEGRLELIEKNFGNFRGASGIQFRHRDFVALGEEAFTPPNVTDQFGVFTVREYETDKWHFQLAGRYEHTAVEAPGISLARDFDTISVSGGAGFEPNAIMFVGVNAFRTERAPAPEELFSDGPHLATNAFEIGNPDLGTETALGVEASVHFDWSGVSATINGFNTNYDDFVSLLPTGGEEDGLPVFLFEARDAVFRGFEAELEADLFTAGSFDVSGRTQVDFVRARFRDGAGDVPRIPPLRSIIGVEADSDKLKLSAELEIAASQDRISEFELPTDGFEVVNLGVVFRPMGASNGGPELHFRADNVTDEDARQHTSFLKDVAPLPGRNFSIALRGTF